MKTHAFTLLFLFASTQFSPAHASTRESRVFFNGPSLSAQLDEILASPFVDACDQKTKSLAREITAAIDIRGTEIAALASKQPISSKFAVIPFGDLSLREYTGTRSSDHGWMIEKYVESWQNLYVDYQKVKDLPVNLNWVALNSDVRSILVDDQERVFWPSNLALKHDSGELIETLLKIANQCVADTECSRPLISAELNSKIQEIPKYRDLFSDLASASNPKDTLSQIINNLENDLTSYALLANAYRNGVSAQKQDGITLLSLPIDGSNLSGVQRSIIKTYFEKVWTSPAARVILNWVSQDNTPEAFKIILENQPGERAYVNGKKKEIHLFPMMRIRSIAHELGHVLGIPDHYYLLWNANQCSYQYEVNLWDLMSDSTYGEVTADEWKMLLTHYAPTLANSNSF